MRSLETFLAAATGAALGGLIGLPLGITVWTAPIGALNGALSGFRQIYPWRTAGGWTGFVLDSTWGLVGTAGALLSHILQGVLPSGTYRPDLSHRRGRHVYEGGYRIRPGFAAAIGNVITNAGGKVGLDGAGGPRRRLLIDRHEMLHVWQHRWFGPLFPILYSVWLVLGALAGVVIGLTTDRTIRKSAFTLGYHDNPFEYWAYRRDRYWPPAEADPALAWKGQVE